MARGTIKTVTDRGFGFIRPEEGGDGRFFHRSALAGVAFDQLRAGDRVAYATEPDPRGRGGLRAARVRLGRGLAAGARTSAPGGAPMTDASLDALMASLRAAFQTGNEVAIDDPSPLQREALARVLAELGRDGWRFSTQTEPGRYRVLGHPPASAP